MYRYLAPRSIFSVVFFLYFFALPTVGQAALLYFDPDVAEIYRGDTTIIDLRIDTDEGECINTVDVVIQYDATIQAEDVSRGQSILSLWVEDPVIDPVNHTITLAGGIPNGYCGRIAGDPSLTNVVAQIVFRSPGFAIGAGANPVAKITIDPRTQVLLNDGFGTPAPLRTTEVAINLLSTAGPQNTDAWKNQVSDDIMPPGDFVITLSREESAFSGKYFISFNSQDKQSGIDHYEVMEEPIADMYSFTWGRADAPWVVAESPYVLTDQSLNSTIRVRAIDKAGNKTIAVFVPTEAMRGISNERLGTMLVVGVSSLLMILLVVLVLIRRKKRIIDLYEPTE